MHAVSICTVCHQIIWRGSIISIPLSGEGLFGCELLFGHVGFYFILPVSLVISKPFLQSLTKSPRFYDFAEKHANIASNYTFINCLCPQRLKCTSSMLFVCTYLRLHGRIIPHVVLCGYVELLTQSLRCVRNYFDCSTFGNAILISSLW